MPGCSDIDNVIYDTIGSCQNFGICIHIEERCAYASESFISMLQYSTLDDIKSCHISQLYTEESIARIKPIYTAMLSNTPTIPHLFGVAIRMDGSTINIVMFNFKIEYFGKPAILTLVIDVSFDKDFKIQLPVGHKHTTVEMLARGVAHEINNMVGAISGNLEMVSMSLQESSHADVYIKQAADACKRGKEFSRRLFRLAPRDTEEPASISITSIANAALHVLNASIPESITVRQKTSVSSGEDIIRGNPAHIMEMLLDLLSHAVQAMNDTGGVLEMELIRAGLDSITTAGLPSGMQEGQYLKLSIRHTGQGIDPSLGSRIFDPFSSTGGNGGSGGLLFAAAAATMRNLAGTITLDTEMEKGCAFHMFFPLSETLPKKQPVDTGLLPTGSGWILLIEEDEELADWGMNLLEGLGYTPVRVPSGDEAIALLTRHGTPFGVVIADRGALNEEADTFMQKLTALHPDVSIILWVGDEGARIEESSAVHLLRKPASDLEFATAVRNALPSLPDAR